jgi:hypothetical protein
VRDERARVDHEHETGDGKHDQVEEEVPSLSARGWFRVGHGERMIYEIEGRGNSRIGEVDKSRLCGESYPIETTGVGTLTECDCRDEAMFIKRTQGRARSNLVPCCELIVRARS